MSLKIFKRGKVYHYSGTVDGDRLRGTTRTADKETAARIAAEAEARHWKRHLDGPAAVLMFSQAAANYEAAGRSMRFVDVVEDYWKDTLVKDITAGAIRSAAIEVYPRATPATRNRQFIVPTQAIINLAAEMELCPPIRVKRFKTNTRIKKPVTAEWVEAFMAKATNDHIAALCLFMFLTGARVSEAVNLKWTDVDLQARKATIRQTKVKIERVAHLPPPLVAKLANLERFEGRGVFSYITRGAAHNSWVESCRRAGIEYLSPHSCRHGFATSLLHKGVDVVTIAKLGGWQSPDRVFRTYGHAKDDPTITDLLWHEIDTAKSAKRASSRKRKAI